ncbi:tetratricopeptide repeat protein [Priestia megaterium]|uniref:tetratricopeptide repeat protein n=1 Tax=Priestia megaterium TaxID=1404 RepID=UPI003FD5D284
MIGNKLPVNLNCEICNNIAVYSCKATNKKICRFCCDKYQLSSKPIDECLKCDYLVRDVGYEVKLKKGMIVSHQYKDKYVFDGHPDFLSLKAVELYEKLGVHSINEMYNLAIQYYYANRSQDALELYNKIIKKNIDKADKIQVYEQMGDAFLSLKSINEAKDAYIKSLDYGNVTPKIYRRIGEVYNILEDYGQSIYYHEKALKTYFSYDWVSGDNGFEDDDFLYFTNFYSLAMGYSKLNSHEKVIENANAFFNYYGDFNYIKERYFMKDTVQGDHFMPESIVSMYKLITLNYIEMKDYLQAQNNIKKARTLLNQDTELAKLEGFINGKLDNELIEIEVAKLKQEIVEKDRALMVLIHKSDVGTRNYSISIGEINMGNKYHIENSGNIGNQVFGDNVTY